MSEAAAPLEEEKTPPAVEGGVLKRLSVSQVQLFDPSQDGGCPRKWFAEKVLGRKPASSKAQEIGTHVHAQIEHYLKTGEDVLGPVARAGKHFLPDPDPSQETLACEVPFSRGMKGLSAVGVPFVGFMDLVNATGFYADESGERRDEASNAVEIADWKTSRDVAKWAKPASALMRTVQMPGYGVWAAENLPGVERVRLSHVTFQTEGKKHAVKSTVLVPVEKLYERWRTVEGVVREMKDVAKETDIARVPMNLNACGAYGGCPHKEVCPRSPEAVLRDAFGGKSMSLLRNLTRTAPAAPTTTTPPPAEPVVVQAPPPSTPPPATGGSLLGRLGAASKPAAPAEPPPRGKELTNDLDPAALAAYKAKAAAPRTIPAAQAIQGHHYEVKLSTGAIRCRFICLTKGGYSFKPLDSDALPMQLDPDTQVGVLGTAEATAVLPPGTPVSGVSGPKAEGLEAEDPAVPAKKSAEKPTEDEQGEITEALASVVGEAAPAAEAPKRGRGRPPGSKNKPKAAEEPAEIDPPDAEQIVPPKAQARLDAAIEKAALAEEIPDADMDEVRRAFDGVSAALHVFIDSYPVKGTAKNLEPHVREVCAAICETFKVQDIRLGDNSTPLGYGKWKACLQVALKVQPPPPGSYYLLARGDEVLEAAASALVELADFATVGR